MGFVVNIILMGVAFLTFAIAGGYLTNAAVRITGIAEYIAAKPGDQYNYLKNAHYYSSLGAVICWISIALLLAGIVLYIIFGSESIEETGNYIIYGILFFCLAGDIAVGILAAMTAANIGYANPKDNNLAYRQSIIAAVLGIVVFTLLITALIVKFTYKPKSKNVFTKESKEFDTDPLTWLKLNSGGEGEELAGLLE
jgi:hypothetical protein